MGIGMGCRLPPEVVTDEKIAAATTNLGAYGPGRHFIRRKGVATSSLGLSVRAGERMGRHGRRPRRPRQESKAPARP